jgi:ABC-type uncharacterized transport system ATPase subunit
VTHVTGKAAPRDGGGVREPAISGAGRDAAQTGQVGRVALGTPFPDTVGGVRRVTAAILRADDIVAIILTADRHRVARRTWAEDDVSQLIAMINKARQVALGTPTDIKRRFSKIDVVEVVAKDVTKNMLGSLGKLQGAERVDSNADGAFQRVVIHTRQGSKLQNNIAETVGKGNIQSIITREPTLEEANLSLLK